MTLAERAERHEHQRKAEDEGERRHDDAIADGRRDRDRAGAAHLVERQP